MITVLLNLIVALLVAIVLPVTGVMAWYWSVPLGLLCFIAVQIGITLVLRRRMASVSAAVETITKQAQARMHAKLQRWRTKPVSSAKLAEAELTKDRDAMIDEIRAVLAPLYRYRLWIPLMDRQLATMELQFAWQKKDYARVDELLPRALLIDPMLVCIRLARMWQKDATDEELLKVFRKSVRRARYDTTALLYATMAWMMVRHNNIDEAFRLLNEADERNEHPVIKQNRDLLANNRVNQFSNAGFGDVWYAIGLETPKVRTARQNRQTAGRYFM